MSLAKAWILGCFDSKGTFLCSLAECFSNRGIAVLCIDIGSRVFEPDKRFEHWQSVSNEEKEAFAKGTIKTGWRAFLEEQAKVFLSRKLENSRDCDNLQFVVGVGGSNGTTLSLRCFEVIEKAISSKGARFLCVSTVALYMENTPAFVEFVPSLTDIISTNPILEATGDYCVQYLLQDTEGHHLKLLDATKSSSNEALESLWLFLEKIMLIKKLQEYRPENIVAITMFGVTTPCVEQCVEGLTDRGFSCMVFHAVGLTGGQLMAKLVERGVIAGGVIDITTSEIADHLFGGICGAPLERFQAIVGSGLPCIFVPGAIDMIGYAEGNLPNDRVNNPSVLWSPFTLSRTTPDDNTKMAEFFAKYLESADPERTSVLIPNTFSRISDTNGVFYWPPADKAFVDRLSKKVKPGIRLVQYEGNINDQAFAQLVLDEFFRNRNQATNNNA